MLWRKIAPNLIDGSVSEWLATDADFTRMSDAVRVTYVPGHGDVADVKDVADFRGYLLDLRQLVSNGRKIGLKDDALVAAVAPKLRARSRRRVESNNIVGLSNRTALWTSDITSLQPAHCPA